MSELNNIPKNWQVKKLGEVCKFYQGYGFPKDLQGSRSGEYPFYKVGDISKNVKAGNRFLNLCDNFIDEKTLIKLKAKPYPKHTIVFAKIGEGLKLNRRAIINKSGIVDNNAIGLKAIESICNDLFLFHFLTTVKLEDYSKATTVPSVRKSEIEDIHFVLPPLTEQLAIVSKIEELLSDLDNGKQQLLTAQQQLKVYRQSLLKAAFEGRLTNKEVKDGELPKGWKLVEIGTICKCIVPNRDKPKSFTGDIKWVTTPNLSSSSIKLDYPSISMGLSENETVEYNARVIPSGSVIMTCVGTFGLSAVIEKPVVINQQLHAFLSSDLVNPKYIAYCIQNSKSYFEHKSTSTTIQYLNKSNCNSMPFPLTSIEEQNQIVDILESKLTVCDKIEETISQSLLQAETLKQSILKKAFTSTWLSDLGG
ncbi:MAG: restriction endonuclease subunit S [Paludibacter sp.]